MIGGLRRRSGIATIAASFFCEFAIQQFGLLAIASLAQDELTTRATAQTAHVNERSSANRTTGSICLAGNGFWRSNGHEKRRHGASFHP
jgi:hypothetical protein